MMSIFIDENGFGSSNYSKIKTKHPKDSITNVMDEKVSYAVLTHKYINKAYLDKMPNLKHIQLLTAGYDNIDLNLLKENKISLSIARDVFSNAIAEDIITKMLVINRHVKKYVSQMPDGLWERHQKAYEITGSTIGFLGTGSIASFCANKLKGFDVKLIGYRNKNKPHPLFNDIYTGQDGLNYVIKNSDYLIVTLPLNQSTYQILSKEKLQLMKPDAVLINVGRGKLVDQEALINMLQLDLIRGAALDVMDPEPLNKENPLWQMDNVYLTPHIAGSSKYMLERLYDLVEKNIDNYINGLPLSHII